MKKSRRFTPTVDGRLEERVVLSTVATCPVDVAVTPTLTQREINRALTRIDAAIQRAMVDFNKAYKLALKVAPQNLGFAIGRLQEVGDRLGQRLGDELAAAANNLPYGRRDYAAALRNVGHSVGLNLATTVTMDGMRTSGRDIFWPARTAARDFVQATVHNAVASGTVIYRG